MGIKVSVSADWASVDDLLAELGHGTSAGTVVATAARSAIDRLIRKDTGQMAATAEVSAWHVSYPKEYASVVWDVPPQIVSPRNPLAMANPHTDPSVAEKAAEQLALYASRL